MLSRPYYLLGQKTLELLKSTDRLGPPWGLIQKAK